MPYILEAHRVANKELARLPKDVADGIRKALRALAVDPHNPRFDLKPIQGHTSLPPTLRLRLGTYRVLLKVSHERRLVRVLRVGTRETVYRGLDALDEGI
ncbi:MAG: type II toxin-antitoxin system RelE/ParE family toxin [Candidatus Thermoplasmatota archaeon]